MESFLVAVTSSGAGGVGGTSLASIVGGASALVRGTDGSLDAAVFVSVAGSLGGVESSIEGFLLSAKDLYARK